jgi:hypothetical protein
MFPGCYIYIDPRGWTPGDTRWISDGNKTYDITEFGIGGYYMIIRSTTKFAAGQAETSITAKWVQNLEKTEPKKASAPPSDSGDGATAPPDKCSTRLNTGEWFFRSEMPAPAPVTPADADGASSTSVRIDVENTPG